MEGITWAVRGGKYSKDHHMRPSRSASRSFCEIFIRRKESDYRETETRRSKESMVR